MRYALIDKSGVIINVVEWDGDEEKWKPEDGVSACACEHPVNIGWRWIDGKPVDPDPPKPARPTDQELRQREMPSIPDQLEALWAGGDEAKAMKARIDAVKAKYPKPAAVK